MYIPEILLDAMETDGYGCTGVKVYCEEKISREIVSRFKEIFNDEYKKTMDHIEEEFGDCYEKEKGINPFKSARVTDYGVLFRFDALAMYCRNGNIIAKCNGGGETLETALETIKQEYPSISYEGYVAYSWSDIHSGEQIQYRISSEKKKDKSEIVYDFVGEALAELFEDGFEEYEWWEIFCERLEYANEDEFKKIIKLLHTYSKWVPSDAIDRVIKISEKRDEDLTESLRDFADTLKSGKDADIEEEEEIDTSGLPDGYMEAMDMFLMAEEISGKKPKRGEAISSEGTFEIVIEKAESGDAEAKYTAGKYFIADHIEEENERAIRWIREAAEAGVEEAGEYMKEHSEMFMK